MARERTYFKQISLFRARYIYVPCNRLPLISGCVRVSTLPAATTTSRRDATGLLARGGLCVSFLSSFFSFLPRVAEFKRFKAISLGVADRCWSTADWASPSDSIRLVSVFLGSKISPWIIPSKMIQLWWRFFFLLFSWKLLFSVFYAIVFHRSRKRNEYGSADYYLKLLMENFLVWIDLWPIFLCGN